MTANEERVRGVETLTEILSSGRILQVRNPRTFHNGYSYYFEVGAYGNAADFALSSEVLEDMQGTSEYKKQANVFARAVEKRLRGASPIGFMTLGGVPIEIETFWPHEAWSGRAASYVRTNVRDLRGSKVAKCFIVISHQQLMFDLKENPFAEFAGIANSVRDAIDAGNLVFYTDKDHPDTLQRVDLHLVQREHRNSRTVETFLERKVFWLGFKVGNASSLVWAADPWDADYLGVPPSELLRETEILEAHGVVRLDESREFASAGRELLLRARDLETAVATKDTSIAAVREVGSEWDVFISHASEDKDDFVQPLAEELTRRGVRVWYDKFTLTLGDSLRGKIDYGLRSSKFGLVVLSPQFFRKDWPQKELDGLVALEVGGRKVILPVWHNVTQTDVAKYSPILAGRLAVSTSSGLGKVIDEILRAIG